MLAHTQRKFHIMKNTPEDQFVLDFDKSPETPPRNEVKQGGSVLSLVYSKVDKRGATAELSAREKILGDVLTYARSLKW
jgi:hypothetical protein